jgi:hypothetical protein
LLQGLRDALDRDLGGHEVLRVEALESWQDRRAARPGLVLLTMSQASPV